ncbi:MAG: DUF4157 domain-containing protein [Syntrophorhabdus aromaticivorans]|uniref:DUF4157 domain-containing protein n=1 Tax=Syntrophorhabdus aromaticivorans TaxID=328301 RepID=A0A971M413_9BACT|nr:DUF4157 domain-containing protein [Syntrophorhabdus aromaticivorans]
MTTGTREWGKQHLDQGGLKKTRDAEKPGLHACGGCNACHEMTRIHHGGNTTAALPGVGAEGPSLQKPCATTFFQRNLGNAHLQAMNGHGVAPQPGAPKGSVKPVIQRACNCGGSCESSCGKEEENVQAKLTVGAAHDVYEQEADRVASRIMEMSPPSVETGADGSGDGMRISRMTTAGGSGQETASTDVEPDTSGGRPLAPSTLKFMEPRFGVDFSGVSLHADDRAGEKAAQIQAKAFTHKNHIWMGKGETEENRGLMAHELTHVIQQNGISADSAPIRREETQQAAAPAAKTVTVDLVKLRGSSRNPADDVSFANTVFRPANVQFTIGANRSVPDATSDSWLGGDTNLARIHSCTDVDPEEEAMRSGATTAYSLGSRIKAFYVESMTPSERAVCFPGYCAGGSRASFLDHAYVTNSGANRSLSHEFGHILLNNGNHTGVDNPSDTSNLMVPTNSATGENLDNSQRTTIYGNA